jgi:hypothetical protein
MVHLWVPHDPDFAGVDDFQAAARYALGAFQYTRPRSANLFSLRIVEVEPLQPFTIAYLRTQRCF